MEKKRRHEFKRVISVLLMVCLLVVSLASCKKKAEETTVENTTTIKETQTETETESKQLVKRIDLKKYKLKDDKTIFDITKLISKKNSNKNQKLIAACAMSYQVADSRVIRLLYSDKKSSGKYVVKEYLLDNNEFSGEETKFSVKDKIGGNGINVVSLEDMIFSDDTNKKIYAPELYDKPVSYSKVSGGEVFAYNGKPYVFGNNNMEFYEVNKKGKISYNFRILKEKYSSAKLISYNKFKYVQIEAVSPYESRKIYMDVDPDEDVINKYTMEKYDESFEEYSEDRYYELNVDKNNNPIICLYDRNSNIKIKKAIPKSILKLCNGNVNALSVDNDAIIGNNMLISVKNGGSISHIYLWNLKKGKTQKHTFTAKNPFEFTEKKLSKDKLRQKANALEEEYGVEIYIGSDAMTNFAGAYHMGTCTDRGQIEVGLNSLERVLGMYPKGFFPQLDYGSVKGIKIHLTGQISSSGAANTISAGVLAFTAEYQNTQIIVIDITQMMQISTIAHEITHMIDRKLEHEGYLLESEWAKLNPSGFEYRNRYVDENGGTSFDSIDAKYTYYAAKYGDASYDDVYFYDDYAKTYSTEDRARIMQFLMGDGYANEEFLKCKHIIKKLKYYKDIINECFDTSGWGTTTWEERINEIS